MKKEYDYLFKLVIVGNAGVGKSSLLSRFSDDTFSENYLTTLGVDFRFKTIPVDGKNVKLQIWDTAGQERFRTITNAYYRGASGIILVYDITNEDSFNDIEEFWLNEIDNYADKNVDLILIGNKFDLIDQQSNSSELAKVFCEKKNILFFETSAKENKFVHEAFRLLSRNLIKKSNNAQLLNSKKATIDSLSTNGSVDVKKQKSSCC